MPETTNYERTTNKKKSSIASDFHILNLGTLRGGNSRCIQNWLSKLATKLTWLPERMTETKHEFSRVSSQIERNVSYTENCVSVSPRTCGVYSVVYPEDNLIRDPSERHSADCCTKNRSPTPASPYTGVRLHSYCFDCILYTCVLVCDFDFSSRGILMHLLAAAGIRFLDAEYLR